MLFDMSRGKVGLILKFGTDIERVINKEHFYGKICRKCASKIYLGKQPKTANACERLFRKKDILKEDYQKTFKKLTWFFPLHPVPCYGQDYEKQKGPGTNNQALSLGCKTCPEQFLF